MGNEKQEIMLDVTCPECNQEQGKFPRSLIVQELGSAGICIFLCTAKNGNCGEVKIEIDDLDLAFFRDRGARELHNDFTAIAEEAEYLARPPLTNDDLLDFLIELERAGSADIFDELS